jgi:hypothetical protein
VSEAASGASGRRRAERGWKRWQGGVGERRTRKGAHLDLGRAAEGTAASARRVMAMEEAMAGGGAVPWEGKGRGEKSGGEGDKRRSEDFGGEVQVSDEDPADIYFLPRFLPLSDVDELGRVGLERPVSVQTLSF